MKLCYNLIMNKLIRIILFLILITTSTFAATFDVLVLPTDIIKNKENYYGFDNVSEIISNDIIYEFNRSNGKIKSPDLYKIREKINQNRQTQELTAKALLQYKNTNKIDYATFKEISKIFNCQSVLIVSSYATTNKNSVKRDVWELLELTSNFDISYPYRLETPIVLLDTVNDLVMWSNNYSSKLGTNNNIFKAKNYAEANAQYEKIKIYSKNVVAPSASQNIILRFYPKSIKPILKENNDIPSGGALRFERKLPEEPLQLKPKENFYGETIYGL